MQVLWNINIDFDFFKQDPILRLRNLQLQRQRCSSQERFYSRENNFVLKTRSAISCVVIFYTAGVVTHSRKIFSRGRCYDHNFLRFGKKLAFFSKTNVMIKILHNLALF
jgi:hypothetical protein